MLLCSLSRLIRDSRGNIGVMTAILIIPVVGALGLATEASAWFLVDRAEQSAADSAAIAAAANNDAASNGTGYILEARAVAAKYGFTNGTNNTTVNVIYQTVASVPNCVTTSCYVVTIAHSMPIFLSSIVGYQGNVALGSGRGESIQAAAVATPKSSSGGACDTSLGSAGQSLRLDGLPKAGDPISCAFDVNGTAKCSHNVTVPIFQYAPLTQNPCNGAQPASQPFQDPYAGKYIAPSNPCTSYNQEATSGKTQGAASLPNSNLLKQSTSVSSTPVCGDAALFDDVTVSGASNVLVIENGELDLNGHTLTTASGAGLTIVFSGTNGGSYSHTIVDNGGGLDIAAPISGIWSGVGIWQDPSLTSNVDITQKGNNTFAVTGTN
jgi:Flp pilus assembly protein TadG